MRILGMHLSLWLLMIGALTYFIVLMIISHYMKIKVAEVKTDQQIERRRASERRNIRSKEDKKVPGLKWTMPVGTIAFFVAIIGLIWSVLRMLGILS